MNHTPDTKRLHVIFLPRWYPHRYDPMLGLFVARHAGAVQLFADVSVLYVFPDDQLKRSYEFENQELDGVHSVTCYFKKSTLKPGFLAGIVNLYRFIASHQKGFRRIKARKGKPDLLHVHVLTRLGLMAFFYWLFTKTPYVITEHWSRYHRSVGTYKGFLRKFLTKIVVKKAGAVMPVTENLKDAMLGWGLKNKHYVVVPNVVDVSLFKPMKKVAERKVKNLVHLSCFSDRFKNISGILRVIKKLGEQRNDFFLRLIGEGEDLQSMKNYAEKLGIKGISVSFEGLKENQDLVDLLAASDAMIMFSNAENLPVVMLESFACGVPVISSRVGGIHEHLNNERGLLTEPQNEDLFLQNLNNFLDKLEQYDSQKIREYAVNHFSKEMVGKAIFQVYVSTLKERNAGV